MIRFHVITLFPEAFESYLASSMLARAAAGKKIAVALYNPRDFIPLKAPGKRRQADDRPYGGGPGMVLRAEPVLRAAAKALAGIRRREKQGKNPEKARVKAIFFSPSGKEFTTEYAKRAAAKVTDLILICGHYEGVDARVRKILKAEMLSVGPYVLTGGELPAMIMIDCISRQIPGVLGHAESLEETRTASADSYTRPEAFEWEGKRYRVPKVLLSGDHKKIEEWRREKNS